MGSSGPSAPCAIGRKERLHATPGETSGTLAWLIEMLSEGALSAGKGRPLLCIHHGNYGAIHHGNYREPYI